MLLLFLIYFFKFFYSQAQLFAAHTVGICQAGINSPFQLCSADQRLEEGGKSLLCMELCWCCSARANLSVPVLSAFAFL